MATKFKNERLKNGNIRTCEVRLAYVNLVKPRDNNGRLKYGTAILFPKGADLSLLKKAVEAAGEERWGDKYPAMVKAGKIRSPFKDQGSNIDDEGEPRAGFEDGLVYISATANEDRRPPVVGADLTPIDSDEIYSGMWARASIRAFSYDTDGNRGVSFGLQAVQKLWDDEPLAGAGKVNVENEFEPVEVDEGGDADSVFD